MTTQQLYTTTQAIHRLLENLGLKEVESDFWIKVNGTVEYITGRRLKTSEDITGFVDEMETNEYYLTEKAVRQILVEAFGKKTITHKLELPIYSTVEGGNITMLMSELLDVVSSQLDSPVFNHYSNQISNYFFTTNGRKPCLWDSKGGELQCLQILEKELKKLIK